ncbi:MULTISPECIES: autotransporter outer membrane beta-barrel domain-containing protein [unclassified Bartonella]|uniref:autotransporter outer membrane beta-barrel domain-containing protein n=1 Tax=unclassified Bartonella TaxID=2645622 RepID=UPI002362CADB|nr:MULTISPECIES: autotransporter outer membrane beta-barrel domain-containing protein [unclassified Bartonella]
MINVVKNRACLCALTTSALFFLQGGGVSMGSDSSPQSSSILPVVGAYTCGVKSFQSEPLAPIFCQDGKEHSAKYGSIHVKSYGANAVTSMGKLRVESGSQTSQKGQETGDFPEEGVGVDETTIKLRNMSIKDMTQLNVGTYEGQMVASYVGTDDMDPDDIGPEFGSAIFATVGGKVELQDSGISNFLIGLYSEMGGKIIVKRGRIHSLNSGAQADSDSLITLDNTTINVEGLPSLDQLSGDSDSGSLPLARQNSQVSGLGTAGLHSYGQSGIVMKSGSIALREGGSAAISEGGFVTLDNVSINIKKNGSENLQGSSERAESQSLDEGSFKSNILLANNGFISYKNGKFDGSDVAFLWVLDTNGNDDDEDFEDYFDNEDELESVPSVNGVGNLPSVEPPQPYQEYNSSLTKVKTLMPQFLGEESSGTMNDLWVNAVIDSSDVTLNGQASVGVYFSHEDIQDMASLDDDSELEDQSMEGVVKRDYFVLLKDTTLKVPEGKAIYGENTTGSVIIDKSSKVSGSSSLKGSGDPSSTISGDLLLEATSNAHLSVFINGGSIIKGGTHIDQNSHAKIFLNSGSEWHLTKSKKTHAGCGSSCVSSINLKDATIKFVSAENGEKQTLRVGRGSGVVYTASGDSHIYFNASVNQDNSKNSQISDRLLIHGNVSGQTKVHVNERAANGTESGQRDNENNVKQKHKYHSVSIIQVYGEATKDSFKLANGYVTISGLPYQYILRGYGPTLTPKMQFFDGRLLETTQVWDFRLESKIQKENGTMEDPPLATDVALGEYMEMDLGFAALRDVELEFENTKKDIVKEKNINGGAIAERSNLDDSSVGPNSLAEVTTPPLAEGSDPEIVSLQGVPTVAPFSALARSDTDEAVDYSGSERPTLSTPLLETTDEQGEALNITLLPNSNGGINGNEAEYTLASGVPTSSTERTENVNTQTVTPLRSSEVVTPITHEKAKASKIVAEPAVSIVSKEKELAPEKKEGGPVGRILLSAGPAKTSEVNTLTVSSKPAPLKSQDSKVVSINDVGQGNVSSQCDSTQENGEGESRTSYSCSDGGSHTIANRTLEAKGEDQHSVRADKDGTVLKLENTTIIGAGGDNENSSDVTERNLTSAVLAEENAEVVLDNKSTIKSSVIGLEAKSGGKVKMTDGTVNARYVGTVARPGSSVNLKDTKINVEGALASAGLVSSGGEITMDSGSISVTGGAAVKSESGGNVNLDSVKITVKKQAGRSESAEKVEHAVILLDNNGSVDLKNGTVSTDATALWIKESGDAVKARTSRRRKSADVRPSLNRANIEFSTFKVEGNQSYGIYFDGTKKEDQQRNQNKDSGNVVAGLPEMAGAAVEKVGVVKSNAVSQQKETPIHVTGAISLKKTNFEVANGIAIYANGSNGQISLEKETILAGDLLLSAENNSSVLAVVDNSVIVGGTRVDKGSYAKLDLTNKSTWILTRSAHKIDEQNSECVDSCISSLSLVNSRMKFVAPKSEEKYQTLHIGEGKGIVYRAEGDVSIHLNAHLSPNDPSDEQVTDRLVIHGDVSGKTTVHVQGISENIADKGHVRNPHSVSIIQVYGTAAKDSFQLDGNYVALQNSPYKYTLRSYSPKATAKQEHVEQKFIKDGGEFWNFRLENQYVKSTLPTLASGFPEQFVRSVVPQVPTYLLLPNSVFHAGLMDVNNQSKQLEALRATYNGMVEVRENPALYLRGYGGSYRYTSNLSALEYGYKGDLNYNGLEAGLLLQTIESTDSAISFGVLGSYGKLSLQPVDVEQSQESAFDKWTATAYGSMQHDAGFYVDGLLSYGLLKGDVLTLARGKTATLKGNPLSVSLTGGQTIATGYEGFIVDPQVQVVYQHLQFEKARDIDNFDIEMGKLDQWVARVGGRLTKTPKGSEGLDAISFYSKLYLVHGFEGKKSVQFKDAFQLGAFGSSLEAGLGFNAKLSSAFSLHADLVYQHKLNKAGFSGTSFSGGVRYQF